MTQLILLALLGATSAYGSSGPPPIQQHMVEAARKAGGLPPTPPPPSNEVRKARGQPPLQSADDLQRPRVGNVVRKKHRGLPRPHRTRSTSPPNAPSSARARGPVPPPEKNIYRKYTSPDNGKRIWYYDTSTLNWADDGFEPQEPDSIPDIDEWVKFEDKFRRQYYFWNSKTRKSQRHQPEEYIVKVQEESQVPPLAEKASQQRRVSAKARKNRAAWIKKHEVKYNLKQNAQMPKSNTESMAEKKVNTNSVKYGEGQTVYWRSKSANDKGWMLKCGTFLRENKHNKCILEIEYTGRTFMVARSAVSETEEGAGKKPITSETKKRTAVRSYNIKQLKEDMEGFAKVLYADPVTKQPTNSVLQIRIVKQVKANTNLYKVKMSNVEQEVEACVLAFGKDRKTLAGEPVKQGVNN